MDRNARELEDILRALAVTIRARREQLGLSQEDLAQRAGLHRTYISDVERGARNVALKNLVRLADALDMDITDLFAANAFRRGKMASDER